MQSLNISLSTSKIRQNSVFLNTYKLGVLFYVVCVHPVMPIDVCVCVCHKGVFRTGIIIER